MSSGELPELEWGNCSNHVVVDRLSRLARSRSPPGQAPAPAPLPAAKLRSARVREAGIASLGRVTTRIARKDKLFTSDHRTVDFDPYDGVPGLLVALDEIERRYRGQLSFPLHVNIRLIRQWLDRDPVGAAAWLKLS